jgi:hypothetical protein
MIARLAQIDLEIADVERIILLKNKTIVFALQRGKDTASQEKQVGLLNKSLQVKKGRRRKVLAELNLLAGRCPNQRAAKL